MTSAISLVSARALSLSLFHSLLLAFSFSLCPPACVLICLSICLSDCLCLCLRQARRNFERTGHYMGKICIVHPSLHAGCRGHGSLLLQVGTASALVICELRVRSYIQLSTSADPEPPHSGASRGSSFSRIGDEGCVCVHACMRACVCLWTSADV